MAELIATGTTLVTSSEFTLTSTDVVTISLKSATDPVLPSSAQAVINLKTSSGTFIPLGSVTSSTPAILLNGPGTYTITRPVQSLGVGVDKT